MPQIIRQRGTRPGRHHLGTPGDIISECLGDFVGIRTEDHNAKRRIACPLLTLWGKGGPLDRWYVEAGGPLGIWRNWAEDVSGRSVEGGHFFPEHNPRETITELRTFFSA